MAFARQRYAHGWFPKSTHKYVVSSKLEKLECGPATLLKGDLSSEVTKLKEMSGKDIQIPGCPTLGKSLMREGVLDRLILSICPIGVGNGLRLFEGTPERVNLKLIDSRISQTGVVSATYANADHESTGTPKGTIPRAPPSSNTWLPFRETSS